MLSNASMHTNWAHSAIAAARSGDHGYASEQMHQSSYSVIRDGRAASGSVNAMANAKALEEEMQADQNAIKRLRYDTRCLKSTPDVPFKPLRGIHANNNLS
jgi:hypothetical protein